VAKFFDCGDGGSRSEAIFFELTGDSRKRSNYVKTRLVRREIFTTANHLTQRHSSRLVLSFSHTHWASSITKRVRKRSAATIQRTQPQRNAPAPAPPALASPFRRSHQGIFNFISRLSGLLFGSGRSQKYPWSPVRAAGLEENAVACIHRASEGLYESRQ
jgi:hypothetical protein